MFLPFPVLLKSHIQKRKKAVLLCLLALGTFITIIQVIRIQTISSLTNYLDSSKVIMWSAVENNLGIVVASIPTLAPLFTYFVDKTTQKSSSANSRGASKGIYAFKSKRSTKHESIRLASGIDSTTHNNGSIEHGSEESILQLGIITRKTELLVSSQERNNRQTM